MITERFMELFKGLERAHGIYTVADTRSDGKLTGKAVTVREKVTLKLWTNHLAGTAGLGIIPINDDSKAMFGAIDIDVYKSFSPKELSLKIEKFKLPLIVCKSKSGGAHVYLFMCEFVSAELIQNKLKELAAGLGFGSSEIFPKQIEILAERGDIGQWINMPYFNSKVTDRYSYKQGKVLDVEGFLSYSEQNKIRLKDLENLKIPVNLEELEEGPPCLQILTKQGFPEGTRNNGLFNLAVYARKAFPDQWKKMVDTFNIKYMDPPLPSQEVLTVIKSADKKAYQYTCSRAPIAAHCNAPVCRLRKHGIGNDSGNMPTIHSLTKFNSNPPIWFLDIDGGGRMELETGDLQNQKRFQLKCMEKLNTMPAKMNENSWAQLINHLFENITIIEAPADASPVGQLLELLERFCTGRAQADTKDEMLLGKPYGDEERHYFRVADFMAYLDRAHFREYKVHQVTSIIKQNNGQHHFFNIKGKGVNCWSVPAFVERKEKLETPKELDETEVPF